jgi:hypothetical protein
MPPRETRTSRREMFKSLEDVRQVLDDVPSLKIKSAKTYINHLKLFLKDLKNDNVYTLLNDYEKTADYVENKQGARSGKPITLETRRTYFVTLNSVAGHVDFVKAKAKTFWQSKQDTYNKLAHEARAKNKVLPKHGNDPPKWSELKDLSAEFKNGSQFGANHLIVSLYTLIAPRRGEYRTLFYLDKKPDGDIALKPRKAKNDLRDAKGTPWNFIYPNDDGKYTMVLRDYKTNQTYDVYQKVLPADLSKVIGGYIKKHDIEPNTVLFRTNRERKDTGEAWKSLKDGNWTTKISSAFALKYKRHKIAVDVLRHAFINSLKLNDMTTEEKEAIALDMGHSVTYQDLYRQYITDAPEELEVSEESTEDTETLEQLYIKLGKAYIALRDIEARITMKLKKV